MPVSLWARALYVRGWGVFFSASGSLFSSIKIQMSRYYFIFGCCLQNRSYSVSRACFQFSRKVSSKGVPNQFIIWTVPHGIIFLSLPTRFYIVIILRTDRKFCSLLLVLMIPKEKAFEGGYWLLKANFLLHSPPLLLSSVRKWSDLSETLTPKPNRLFEQHHGGKEG